MTDAGRTEAFRASRGAGHAGRIESGRPEQATASTGFGLVPETVDCFAPGGDLILVARQLGIVNESAP